MRAWAPRRGNRRAKRTSKRKLTTRTAPPPLPAPPALPPPRPYLHFEGAWTDSWCHRRCEHEHETILEAAQCALPHGCGWYVIAVEDNKPRGLSYKEEKIVDRFRFGARPIS